VVALVAALSAALPVATRAQDWRRAALAAFDEAWQTIHDTYYDPTFGGLDWMAVRTELRPRAEDAESPDAVRRVINDMLGRLGQSHFVLMTSSAVGQPLAGDAMVAIEVRVIDDLLVVTRSDDETTRQAIRAGDAILTIDGVDPWEAATGVTDRARRIDAWRRGFRALHGAPGSAVQIALRDADGRDRTVQVARVRKAGDVVTLGNLPALHVRTEARQVRSPNGHAVGVIGFNVWMAAVAEPFARAVDDYRGAGGIVIDLRGNAGGLAEMMRGVAGHFLPTPALLGRMRMRGATLEFRANPRRSTSDGRRVEPFAGPLAILVDEQTASASECFAGAMQSLGRARVFGRETMGQALPASTRELSNGDVLMYAVGDFTTSNGRRLEGEGVVPDERVTVSRRALALGRDEVLERALQWIDERALDLIDRQP
jgi:carboxyl-terminal processing protease